MFCYVDESGVFTTSLQGKQSVSLVGVLLVPDDIRSKLFSKYKKLCKKISFIKELKGSSLSNDNLTTILKFFNKFDIIFLFCAIDLTFYKQDDLKKHRSLQAKQLEENTRKEYSKKVNEHILSLSNRIAKLAPQLYVQLQLNTLLIDRILNEGLIYYAQRSPKTLSHFKFIIDKKDKMHITKYEKLWLDLVKPFLQDLSMKRPSIYVPELDYSFFDKFVRGKPDYPGYLTDFYGREAQDTIDIGAFLNDINFKSSEESTGIQIVDNFVNATRRTLLGKLPVEAVKALCKNITQKPIGEIKMYNLFEKDIHILSTQGMELINANLKNLLTSETIAKIENQSVN